MGKKPKQNRPERPPNGRGPFGFGRLDRRTVVILGGLLVAGLLLRVGYLVELTGQPDFDHPLVDAHYHDYWARAVVSGDWSPPEHEPDPEISTHPYFRPPGYPWFLSGVYAVFGDGYLAPRLLQMVLGLLGALLVFALARRLFDDGTALVAAGLSATYWVFIYFEGELLEPALSVPLIVAFVLSLLRWRDRGAPAAGAAAGVLLGLLALVRPNALVLLPVAVLWMYGNRRSSGRKRRAWPAVALLVAGTAAAVLPATMRNYRVSGDFVLISSNAGINLLIGNSPRADGEVRGTIPGIGTLDTSFDYPSIVRRVERIEGRPMSHAEVNRFLAARAMKRMADDPARTLRLMARKTALFWGPDEVADNKVVGLDRSHSRWLRAIPLSFALVLSLGIVGLALAWSRRSRRDGRPGDRAGLGLVLVMVLVWFASHLPIAVTSRYRVPVIPFVIVFAAYFLLWLTASLRARRYRSALPWVAALAALLVFAHVDLAGYEDNAARWHYQRAIAFQQGGDLQSAIAQYREALRINPDYGAVYNDLAAALATEGRIADSVPYFRKALAYKPTDPAVHLNLAMALEAIGERAQSHARYREVLRLSPDNPDARAGFERTRGPDSDAPPEPPQ